MKLKINGKVVKPESIHIQIELPSGSLEHKQIVRSIRKSKTFLIEIDGKSLMKVSGYASGYFDDTIGKVAKIEFVGD